MSDYLKNILKENGELYFSGISGISEDSFAAGKVFIWSPDSTYPIPEAPIICALDSYASSEIADFIHKNCPSALIISSAALSSKLLAVIVSANIPYLILKDTPSVLLSQNGRIALLDAKRKLLIVNPAIETLNAYPISSGSAEPTYDVFGELKLIPQRDKKRFLLDAPSSAELFDALTDVSERLGAPPIALVLSVPRSKRDEELFCENTEALFRSAVYGDLSLMLKDYIFDSELSYAFSLMHKVFCRLQEEGREFNGYIKKGLLISSPAYLMKHIRLQKPDFICFELDTLLCRLFGCSEEHLAHSNDIREGLRSIWSRYLDSFAPDCTFWVKTRFLEGSKLLNDFISFARIRDVYIDKK